VCKKCPIFFQKPHFLLSSTHIKINKRYICRLHRKKETKPGVADPTPPNRPLNPLHFCFTSGIGVRPGQSSPCGETNLINNKLYVEIYINILSLRGLIAHSTYLSQSLSMSCGSVIYAALTVSKGNLIYLDRVGYKCSANG